MELNVEELAKAAFDSIVSRVCHFHSKEGQELTQERIDRDLLRIQVVLDDLHEVALIEMAKMRRRRNDLVPVSCLPQEVLGEVFVQAVDDRVDCTQDFVDVKYPTRISTLAKVSSAWNETMLATPQIWCHISTKHPPSFIRAALRRSAASLVNVELDFSDTDGDPVVEASMLRIVAQLPRWRSARIYARSNSDLDILTYSLATKLQNLVVKCADAGPISPLLFGGGTPALKYADMPCLPSHGPHHTLTDLQSLTLRKVSMVEPDAFFSMLRTCPATVKLELWEFKFTPYTVQPQESPVTLPNLQELTLFDISATDLNTISLHLSCPAVRQAFIRAWKFPLPILSLDAITEVFLPTFEFVLRLLLSTDSSASKSMITTVDQWALYFQSVGSKPFTVGFGGVACREVAKALLEFLRPHIESRVSAVVLGDGFKTDLGQALDRWPSLRKLVDSEASEVVTYLTTPTSEDGVTQWHLPHLKYVYLASKNYNNAEDVLQMVRSRKGRCHSTGSDVTLKLPAPFRKIHIKNGFPMDMVTFLKIQNALGAEGEVIWDEKPHEDE